MKNFHLLPLLWNFFQRQLKFIDQILFGDDFLAAKFFSLVRLL